ncbi:hypothetical protein IP81_10045 [Novosphingobium sp. AAP83]|uniref:sulfotransferase family protein n=1 Tax=Novosphingobium sp. AAP83 TaxID=1523425 RepID=UPI0006B9AD5C|nr:sulfotransferase [Novosphingobium sp. AAP83]KPF91732.1 hypothetical protein IP81_10045 [Novosphingobium sp. AAP83]
MTAKGDAQRRGLVNRSPIHFISGLPRSGSTLLSALLAQNPRFAAGVVSPVQGMFNGVLPVMGAGEFATFFDDERRAGVLRSLVDGYHRPAPDGVAFDSNRLWTGKLAILRALYPDARVICCVRHVGWIIDSIERLVRANPLQQSTLFAGLPAESSLYQRASYLLNAEKGLIGQPWSLMREAWFSALAPALIVIDYERLTANPRAIIAALYKELGEEPFAHDFDNLAFDTPEYDTQIGLPGLHRVRPKLEAAPRPLAIPPDLFNQHEEAAFWRRRELNQRGAVVL